MTVTIEKMDPQNFFAQLEDVYQASAFTFYWTNRPAIAEYRITVGPNSFYNVSGYTSETLVANFVAVTATLDDGEQARLVEQISQELHDQGGDLIWGFQRQVAAHRAGLDGVVITQALPILSSATFTPEG